MISGALLLAFGVIIGWIARARKSRSEASDAARFQRLIAELAADHVPPSTDHAR